MSEYIFNLGRGLITLIGGFTNVFFVLSVVIAGTYFLVKHLIPWTDKKWPEINEVPGSASRGKADSTSVQPQEMAAIAAAVYQATSGKGVPHIATKI